MYPFLSTRFVLWPGVRYQTMGLAGMASKQTAKQGDLTTSNPRENRTVVSKKQFRFRIQNSPVPSA
jgi:hypothetical protein